MKSSPRFLLLGTFLWLLAALQLNAQEFLVYFGTFTKTGSKGIYVSRLNAKDGTLGNAELAADIGNCGFLAIHPNKQFLYSVGDLKTPGEKPGGGVSAFSIDRKSGKLTLLNQQSSGGKGPAHLVVDKSGSAVLVANYGGGNIAALRIGSDGKLGQQTAFVQHTGSSVHPQRQNEPHAHAINLDPANRFAFVTDLGLDKVLIYKFDPAAGSLVANDPAFAALNPGAGPRHLSFHPSGRFAYVINELDCTITAFSYDDKAGALKAIQTVSTLPPGESVKEGYSTAEVKVHPSGKFVYGSNRGHDSIAVFEVEAATGKLRQVEVEPTQGKVPRNFNIDPTGQFLLAANQNSDSVVLLRIDAATGRLESTGKSIQVPMPVCVQFLEAEPGAPAVAKWPEPFPGEGPIPTAAWFTNLWSARRTEFWNNRQRDKGAVVFLGDSITQGWGSLAKDFPELKVANRGISGDTTRGVLARLQEDVMDVEPSAVVLLIGTNDIGLGGEPEQVAKNLKLILARLKAHNSRLPVIVCKVMPSSEKMQRPADKIQKLNALVDDLVKADPEVVRLDTWSIFADESGSAKKEEFPDLLHPNAAGYSKWAAALKPVFAKLNLQQGAK